MFFVTLKSFQKSPKNIKPFNIEIIKILYRCLFLLQNSGLNFSCLITKFSPFFLGFIFPFFRKSRLKGFLYYITKDKWTRKPVFNRHYKNNFFMIQNIFFVLCEDSNAYMLAERLMLLGSLVLNNTCVNLCKNPCLHFYIYDYYLVYHLFV